LSIIDGFLSIKCRANSKKEEKEGVVPSFEALAKPRGFAGIQNPEVRIQNEFKIRTEATATHSDY
jgi:hypothetical protein